MATKSKKPVAPPKPTKVSRTFKTILDSLLIAQNVIFTLQALGVDVNHMIGISNAQGPLAEQIKDAMKVAQAEHFSFDDSSSPPPAPRASLPRATKSPKKS